MLLDHRGKGEVWTTFVHSASVLSAVHRQCPSTEGIEMHKTWDLVSYEHAGTVFTLRLLLYLTFWLLITVVIPDLSKPQ